MITGLTKSGWWTYETQLRWKYMAQYSQSGGGRKTHSSSAISPRKRKRADVLIDNNGFSEGTRQHIRDALQKLEKEDDSITGTNVELET